MKLIYIGLEQYNNKYKSLFNSFSVETINYTNPLKACDNLNEISPQIIYIRKDDFPRLWKIVLTSTREVFDDEQCLYILEGELNSEEQKAFQYLKGSINIVDPNRDIERIKDKLAQKNKHKNLSNTYYPSIGELCIGFVRPDDFSFISGDIIQLNETRFIFQVEHIDDIKGLNSELLIQEVSINKAETVITVDIEITQVDDTVTCIVKNGLEEYKTLTQSLFV